MHAFQQIDYAKSLGLILIGDGKRGDIGSTAEAYSHAMFNTWGFDVVTVNPYMGFDSMKPFLEIDGKGAFVVCRSSNNSASQIQDILVAPINSLELKNFYLQDIKITSPFMAKIIISLYYLKPVIWR